MKLPFTAGLAMAAFVSVACANDADSVTAGTTLVPNNHGGYNVTQPGAHSISIPFFGAHGFAAHAIAESRTKKPNYILVPGVEDVGHGGKIVVYKKVYFATPEEAEAARLKLKH
jgi:hypothetical protein